MNVIRIDLIKVKEDKKMKRVFTDEEKGKVFSSSLVFLFLASNIKEKREEEEEEEGSFRRHKGKREREEKK